MPSPWRQGALYALAGEREGQCRGWAGGGSREAAGRDCLCLVLLLRMIRCHRRNKRCDVRGGWELPSGIPTHVAVSGGERGVVLALPVPATTPASACFDGAIARAAWFGSERIKCETPTPFQRSRGLSLEGRCLHSI